MESKFKEKNFWERLKFLNFYVKWIKSADNKDWSSQQAEFINSLQDNSKNFQLDAKSYLKLKI
ncbi:MAG: hypothetical protein GW779_04810 [Candidatus Altiarchaeum hamiconexum]|uniref:Uncharacterized protein n=1 Tax=Candidatus Altarchaeum hamiconexum TaxID=1803513 RepID=A0A8J8CJ81_9ARCH|nr:hypothetical protein [Candidatus Altarchaeum hamiconexum]OIQ05550.1 MAG: hypothetical protein AUK59_03485 [Candidatus Altarchaeum sp. CG2_30_32_3053]PIN67742.1 MAG: hypothetical protein COV98_01705 [Candidatus Altarchaeum sp. CG12_big_fil_rev_8_21_14_0_65_33_22]PIV27230.1 MAG: hypothetical protein COS36_06540 [Candidatus Altarchaeum sp. CG03_land_8_20_14_0_80_32_618]PIX48468.1 MAG: hypothetical protein COZ53_03885 [Candidatus Altarchaeum sp. CG_4_8_14_3_um_filter_33_2054]PIZ31792.1 MAG: hyp